MQSDKKFTIKWNKDILTLNVSSTTASELKKEIAIRTNIEPERQKLLFKGKNLEDNYLLTQIPEGTTLTLMGTASANLVKSDSSQVHFIEDLTKEDKARLLRERGEEVVHGLENLGNTCYFNSVVQCLGRVPELREALTKSNSTSNYSNDMSTMLVKGMGETYTKLDKASDTVKPETLLLVLHTINPLFAERNKGHLLQHDAEELFSTIINGLKDVLPNQSNDEKFSSKLIDELFGIQLNSTLKNIEENSEVKTNKELVYKLPCFIDSQTTELVAGLKASMKENVDLFSNILQRNTVFEKNTSISRLPPYLNVQFIRFFWKQDNELTGAKGGKTKILKSVMFSKFIDLYDLCSSDTQEVLKVGRNIETQFLKDDKNFRIDSAPKEDNMLPTGRYQLVAVVTHQGRSSESGHYIGWVHKKGDNWAKYDDDVVTSVKESDILELKGGGDWHMAYICIYKRLEVPFREIKDN